jgi:hypothetical protein
MRGLIQRPAAIVHRVVTGDAWRHRFNFDSKLDGLSGCRGLEPVGLRLRECLIYKVPVHQMGEKGGNIVEAPMLIVEVVGMLPHVQGQQRCGGCADELLAERVLAAEGLLDEPGNGASSCAPAARAYAVPVEGVVRSLSGGLEQCAIERDARANDLLERRRFERRPSSQDARSFDVRGVVKSVVRRQRVP